MRIFAFFTGIMTIFVISERRCTDANLIQMNRLHEGEQKGTLLTCSASINVIKFKGSAGDLVLFNGVSNIKNQAVHFNIQLI